MYCLIFRSNKEFLESDGYFGLMKVVEYLFWFVVFKFIVFVMNSIWVNYSNIFSEIVVKVLKDIGVRFVLIGKFL